MDATGPAYLVRLLTAPSGSRPSISVLHRARTPKSPMPTATGNSSMAEIRDDSVKHSHRSPPSVRLVIQSLPCTHSTKAEHELLTHASQSSLDALNLLLLVQSQIHRRMTSCWNCAGACTVWLSVRVPRLWLPIACREVRELVEQWESSGLSRETCRSESLSKQRPESPGPRRGVRGVSPSLAQQRRRAASEVLMEGRRLYESAIDPPSDPIQRSPAPQVR
jgi:hypothetical protein